jgi:glycerol-3-phosphate dehydrogenase (NAD(P)+)
MIKELPSKVAVLGGGSFGTAIANFASSNGCQVFQWVRDAQLAQASQQSRENTRYLPGYTLHSELTITADLQQALAEADVVFVSIPSKSFRAVVSQAAPLIKPDASVVSTAKGIEPDGFLLMSQILEQELPNHPIGVLSGPNFALEIIQGQHTGTVIASDSDDLIKKVQKLLSSPTFRVYANHDRYGVELGGALKNIYAIITGMAAAFGTGSNTSAMIITRSLAEMSRFAKELGANPLTFLGLSGVGDLILTCTSNLSRNYRVGYFIGTGKSLAQAVEEIGQVAEGVNTVRIVKQKADELGVYMPLVSGLYQVLFDGKPAEVVAQALMQGEQNYDVEFTVAKK